MTISRSLRVIHGTMKDELRPKHHQLRAAIRSGFLGLWQKWEAYDVNQQLGLVSGRGKVEKYFPSPSTALVRHLETVRDRKTLLKFTSKFGLLGCGEPAGEDGIQPYYRGDSIELCIIHAKTIHAMRGLLAQLNLSRHSNGTERELLAAMITDLKEIDVSRGCGRVGRLWVLPDETLLRTNTFWAAQWILQTAINENTSGIRPFLYFGSAMRTRTWLRFGNLCELAYWQLTRELADDRLRKCKRSDCPKIFEAERRKQVYCSRRCLDIDKQARYARRKK